MKLSDLGKMILCFVILNFIMRTRFAWFNISYSEAIKFIENYRSIFVYRRLLLLPFYLNVLTWGRVFVDAIQQIGATGRMWELLWSKRRKITLSHNCQWSNFVSWKFNHWKLWFNVFNMTFSKEVSIPQETN